MGQPLASSRSLPQYCQGQPQNSPLSCFPCSAPHDSTSWPPRFHKLLLTLGPRPGEPASATCDFAYCDARRFGKVKLCAGDPAESETISKLGWDPLLDMPSLEAFQVGGPTV